MNPLSILTQLRILWSYKGLEPTVAMRKAINEHDAPAILYFASETTVNVSILGMKTTPLHVVASEGKTETLQALIKLGANVDITDNIGNTPLHLAAAAGKTETLQALITLGANIEATDNDEKTPLHAAVQLGKIDSLLILSARGGNLETINNRGLTPLQCLAHRGEDDLRDFLTQANLLDTYNVDEIMESVQVAAQDLRAQAQNQESAMQRLSNAEKSNLKHIKEHYKQQFTQQGRQDSIWNNLKQHLEYEYKKNPAKNSNDQILPLAFDAAKERKPYYTHIIHTAWRYLFQTPNPWMAPDAHWVSRNASSGLSANINDKDKQNMALWDLPGFCPTKIMHKFGSHPNLI